MRALAIGRIVGMLLFIAGIALAISFAIAASMQTAKVEQWKLDRPLDVVIDASKPGRWGVPFKQTCSQSVGIRLQMDIDAENGQVFQGRELLQGLRGKIEISGAYGQTVETVDLNGDWAYVANGKAQLILFGGGLPEGSYWATITIHSGAPSLAGKKQRLFADYLLSTLEGVPYALGGMSILCGLMAIVALIFLVPPIWQARTWSDIFIYDRRPTGLPEPPAMDSTPPTGGDLPTVSQPDA